MAALSLLMAKLRWHTSLGIPSESSSELSYNYGVGRGIFVIKHRILTAFRQWVPLIALLIGVALMVSGFVNPVAWWALVGLSIAYLALCATMSFRLARSPEDF